MPDVMANYLLPVIRAKADLFLSNRAAQEESRFRGNDGARRRRRGKIKCFVSAGRAFRGFAAYNL